MHTRPTGRLAVRLVTPPRLASWNKAGDLDRERLNRYLDHVEEVAEHGMQAEGHLALEFVVGMDGRSLTHESDLDNFLDPVVRRLGPARFSAVFGAKRRQRHSTITVGPTTAIRAPRPADLVVAPTGTYEDRAWLLQIEAACAAAQGLDPHGDRPVRLIIAYDLGPGRNWVNLWKATIDALGPLLGTVPRPRKSHDDPRDGRIVDLELHRAVHPDAGNHLQISFWWDIHA